MNSAQIHFDPTTAFPVPDRLFGSFVEHLGRTVYTGIYEPGHPTSDTDGFRGDVAQLAVDMGVTTIRYPGGNFVSGYRWEDGVGPLELRPTRLDLAWRRIEPNHVGTDDFLAWCERHSFEPMLAVNLGTRGVQEAADLVEYTNIPSGTALSDLRRAHGRSDPWGVKLWCLGNEMDGTWQLGHKTASEYGRLAAEAGRAMKRVDPTIELVACGSSGRSMPTFGDWERTVLEETWDVVDFVSLHAYYELKNDDRTSFLASGEMMRRFILDVIDIIDDVKRAKHSSKEINLSFDEWNVWYLQRFAGEESLPIDGIAPLFEDHYTDLDAVVVGDLLTTLLGTCDRVAAASLAQLVNSLAPILTEPGGPAWAQPTYRPFQEMSRVARQGHVVTPSVVADSLTTNEHGDVPAIAAVVVIDATGRQQIAITNRADSPCTVEIVSAGHAFDGTVVAQISDAGEAHHATHQQPGPLVVPPRSWTLATICPAPVHNNEA